MKRLMNEVRKQAQMANAEVARAKTGLVSGYDSTNYSVKVTLQPEGIETGWLPLLSPWVGAGWGMFCPPSIGDMIEIQFEQGVAEAAFAGMRFYSDADRPLSVPSGEFWLVHKLGSFLKLTNDGKVQINGQAEIDMTAPTLNIIISGNATMTVGGNLQATVQGAAEIDAQGNITHKGGGQSSAGGVVQKDCICAFTGMPHVMISATVKASK